MFHGERNSMSREGLLRERTSFLVWGQRCHYYALVGQQIERAVFGDFKV